MLRIVTFLALTTLVAFADAQDTVYHVGNGVSTPKVLRKVDPEYSREAERDRVQGTALYSIIVDKAGSARNIELLSPLGYGLDEKGIAAIQKWVFKPAEKDGMPVSVNATVEVNFRFEGLPFDARREEHRTAFNTAIHNLQIPDKKMKAIEDIRKLASQSYAPAMSLLGQWMIDGHEVPKDQPGGTELVKKAAGKYDRNGLFVLGMLYLKGVGMPLDREKGYKLLRDASTYGSQAAQFYLGTRFLTGDELIPIDPDRARSYFRLCAATGVPACQFQLGKLLSSAGVAEADPVQALAWLELAREGAVKEAEPLLQSLRERLPAEDMERAEKLKGQLVRK